MELCAATATAAAFILRALSIPAPPGETTKPGWDFKALGGAVTGCVCVLEGGPLTLFTLPFLSTVVPHVQLTFGVIVISEH